MFIYSHLRRVVSINTNIYEMRWHQMHLARSVLIKVKRQNSTRCDSSCIRKNIITNDDTKCTCRYTHTHTTLRQIGRHQDLFLGRTNQTTVSSSDKYDCRRKRIVDEYDDDGGDIPFQCVARRLAVSILNDADSNVMNITFRFIFYCVLCDFEGGIREEILTIK